MLEPCPFLILCYMTESQIGSSIHQCDLLGFRIRVDERILREPAQAHLRLQTIRLSALLKLPTAERGYVVECTIVVSSSKSTIHPNILSVMIHRVFPSTSSLRFDVMAQVADAPFAFVSDDTNIQQGTSTCVCIASPRYNVMQSVIRFVVAVGHVGS